MSSGRACPVTYDGQFMLIFVRSLLFALGYWLATFVYGLLVVFLVFIPPMRAHKFLTSWCWLIIWWLRVTCGVRYRVLGQEHIKAASGPRVILSKHQSTWETLKLQSMFWPASTILKRELLLIPFFGWGLRRFQPIAINRDKPREALKQVKTEGVARIGSGLNVLLFPEGTRVMPGQSGKYARSGPEIALAAGVDILPVAVNAGHCWPARRFLKYPGVVTVAVGPPIAPEGKTSRELIEQVEQWIEATMLQLEQGKAPQPQIHQSGVGL